MNTPLGTALNTDVGTDALSGDCMWQFWCFFGFAMFMSMFML